MPVKIIIHALGLTEVILDVVIWYHGLDGALEKSDLNWFFWQKLKFWLR